MNLERDVEFILFKPEGYKYADTIFYEIENELNLQVAATKGRDIPYYLTREKADEHYYMHRGKPFHHLNLDNLTSGRVIASVVLGEDALPKVIKKAGYWDRSEAEKGTWRERFGDKKEIHKNAIHRADTPSDVKRETSLHFSREELVGKLPTIVYQYIFGI